jgi:hypothetical protein
MTWLCVCALTGIRTPVLALINSHPDLIARLTWSKAECRVMRMIFGRSDSRQQRGYFERRDGVSSLRFCFVGLDSAENSAQSLTSDNAIKAKC